MSKTIELCTNTEWLTIYGPLAELGIQSPWQLEASMLWHDQASKALESLGYVIAHPRGFRSTCHGWNGANTFKRKGMGAGTLDKLSDEEWAAVEDACFDAGVSVVAEFYDWSNKITEITIYVNKRDDSHEGLAYNYCFHAVDQPDIRGVLSGKTESVRDLIAAIEEAINKAGLGITVNDFSIVWPNAAAHWIETYISRRARLKAADSDKIVDADVHRVS